MTAEQERLVTDHVAYAEAAAGLVARRLPRSVDREEVLAVARLALVEAAIRYRPDKGAAFSSYATFRIRGAILDHCRRLDPNTRQARQQIRRGEQPTLQGEAIPVFQVDSYADVVVEVRHHDVAEQACLRADLMAALGRLAAADRRAVVVFLRRQLGDEPGEPIAAELGCSESNVSLIGTAASRFLAARLAA